MIYTGFYRQGILQENAQAVEHDMEQLNAAAKLSFYDDGWEELKDNCITEAARKAIDDIERCKYRREEARARME